jgi:hypothetical protein
MEIIDIGIYATYLFLGLALVSAIVLPLINAIKSPAGLLKSLTGIGALVVLFLISYAISGSEVTTKAKAAGITEASSKMIGAGLTLFYIVFIATVVGVVYSEINKALK